MPEPTVSQSGPAMRFAAEYAKSMGCDCEPQVVGPIEHLEHSSDCVLMRPEDWIEAPDGRKIHRSLWGPSARCTCDPDADGTTDLFCPIHGSPSRGQSGDR